MESTIDAYELRLDKELEVVRTMRFSMESLLQVMECARDDLVILGEQMDKVRAASKRCREQFMERQQQQQQQSEEETEGANKKASAKRKRGGDECIGLQPRRRANQGGG